MSNLIPANLFRAVPAGASVLPSVVEMGPNTRSRMIPGNGRNNRNKTRKNVKVPTVVEMGPVAIAGGGGAMPMPAVVEMAPIEVLKYTPGYGKLSEFEKVKLPGSRYIIAKQHFYTASSMHGMSVKYETTCTELIDNHGQRHGVNCWQKLNDDDFPVPLPDILIDQIKLISYLTQKEDVKNIWNPVAHIENLKKA